MLPNPDYWPMSASTYFYDMSNGEIVLGVAYAAVAFLPASDGKDTKKE